MWINVILINVLSKLPTVVILFACIYTCLTEGIYDGAGQHCMQQLQHDDKSQSLEETGLTWRGIAMCINSQRKKPPSLV